MKSVFLSVLVSLCMCCVSAGQQQRALRRQGPCTRMERLLALRPPMPGKPHVTCDEEGFFAPVQCRGSVCFCTTKRLQRIEDPNNSGQYYKANRWEALDCKCARAEAEFIASGMVGMFFDCEDNGDYAPIQCRGSMCYCADSEGEQVANGEPVYALERDSLNCDQLPVEPQGPCAQREAELAQQEQMPGMPHVVCDADGFYAPVQCQGSVCTCTTKIGGSIENPNNAAQNYEANRWDPLDCKCARAEAEFIASGMVGMFFDCEDNGDYTAIQCRGSMCYCADSEGEQVANGESVYAWERDSLNCDQLPVEPQGPCAQREAELAQQEQMPGMPHVVCDADGFYAPVQCQGSVCTCTTKTGERIEDPNNPGQNYQANRGEPSNCNCARAEAEFNASGMLGRQFDCQDNGNYGPVQCRGTLCFCADDNGEQIANGPTMLVYEQRTLTC